MANRYLHTQRGTVMLISLLAGAVVIGSLSYLNPPPVRWISLALALGFLVLAWFFSSLTVAVNDRDLNWYFGPGAWKYRVPIADIVAVRVVRNSVANGFGIRMRRGFRLYNVSGLDAVEFRLKDGDLRRIGTDDAPGLAAALQS